jgi:hypothetical protein
MPKKNPNVITKKKITDQKIVFYGELSGTPRDKALGQSPLFNIKFTENSGMIVTVGNDNFIPSSKDLTETRNSMNQLAKILNINKANVVVGTWMDRVIK